MGTVTIQEIAAKNTEWCENSVTRRTLRNVAEDSMRELLEACCAEIKAEHEFCRIEGVKASRPIDKRFWRAKMVMCMKLTAQLRKLGGE